MTERDRPAAGERLPSPGPAASTRAAVTLAAALALIAAFAALAPADLAAAAAPPFVLAAGLAALLLPPRPAAMLGSAGMTALAAALYAGAAPTPAPLLLATAASAAVGALIATRVGRRAARPAPAAALDGAVDALTALPNRRGFDQRLRLEIGRLERDPGARLALIVCDLDHAAADHRTPRQGAGAEALRAAAQRIGATVRGIDLTARVGEAEIGVILPGVDSGEAAAIAERIRSEIARRSTEAGPAVAVSCGIASAPEPEPRPQALLEDARRALAAARRAGRDVTAVFDGAGAILIGGPHPGADG